MGSGSQIICIFFTCYQSCQGAYFSAFDAYKSKWQTPEMSEPSQTPIIKGFCFCVMIFLNPMKIELWSYSICLQHHPIIHLSNKIAINRLYWTRGFRLQLNYFAFTNSGLLRLVSLGACRPAECIYFDRRDNAALLRKYGFCYCCCWLVSRLLLCDKLWLAIWFFTW